jgi:hypothetical protein
LTDELLATDAQDPILSVDGRRSMRSFAAQAMSEIG